MSVRAFATYKRIIYSFLCFVFFSIALIPDLCLTKSVKALETDGYPWSDAQHITTPPALDSITWGYTTRTACSSRVPGLVCNASTIGSAPSYTFRDPWGYDLRNCTSYVAWRINQLFGKTIAGWGDAKSWAVNAAKSGYVVDSLPTVGSIAFWNSGHVAIVEGLVGTGPNLRSIVSEYNQRYSGNYSTGRVVVADHYIHIASAPVGLPTAGNPSTLSQPLAPLVQSVIAPSNPPQATQIQPTKTEAVTASPVQIDNGRLFRYKDQKQVWQLSPEKVSTSAYMVGSAMTLDCLKLHGNPEIIELSSDDHDSVQTIGAGKIQFTAHEAACQFSDHEIVSSDKNADEYWKISGDGSQTAYQRHLYQKPAVYIEQHGAPTILQLSDASLASTKRGTNVASASEILTIDNERFFYEATTGKVSRVVSEDTSCLDANSGAVLLPKSVLSKIIVEQHELRCEPPAEQPAPENTTSSVKAEDASPVETNTVSRNDSSTEPPVMQTVARPLATIIASNQAVVPRVSSKQTEVHDNADYKAVKATETIRTIDSYIAVLVLLCILIRTQHHHTRNRP